jgi:ADP-heptose:LPS heptosyltransferase
VALGRTGPTASGPQGPTALVLRALGLGDLLVAVPALRGLRRALPGHRILLAAPASLTPLAVLTGAVDELLPTAGLDDPLPVRAPALAVNLHGRGPQSTALLAATRPGLLWTHGGSGPRWNEQRHEVRRWCDLVGAYGVPADPADLRLALPGAPSPAPGAVVVHPGAAYPSRRWPVERFARVAAGLAADGERVVVTGGPAERDLAAAVAGAAGLPASAVVAGDTDLASLAALVASARLVVCGDTGVGHLATAYRTPSVLLFGPVTPARWGPLSGPHTVLWKGDGGGDPHGGEPDPALLALSAEDVLAAARTRLGRRPVRATATP